MSQAVTPCKRADGRQVVAYVSGPIRDERGTYYVERNIRTAEAIAVELWLAGFAVICPHTNTKHMDGVTDPETWLQGDLELLARSDVVVLAPGWERSVGARRERDECYVRGIPTFEYPGHWLSLLRRYCRVSAAG